MFVGEVVDVSGVYASSIFRICSWEVSVHTYSSVLKSNSGGGETVWTDDSSGPVGTGDQGRCTD